MSSNPLATSGTLALSRFLFQLLLILEELAQEVEVGGDGGTLVLDIPVSVIC